MTDVHFTPMSSQQPVPRVRGRGTGRGRGRRGDGFDVYGVNRGGVRPGQDASRSEKGRGERVGEVEKLREEVPVAATAGAAAAAGPQVAQASASAGPVSADQDGGKLCPSFHRDNFSAAT